MVYRPKYIDRETGERKTAATWWIQFSVRGIRYRQSSRSTNRADAVRLLKHRLGEAAEGRPIGPQIELTTFDDLVRILLDNYRANGRRSLRRVEGGAKHLREFFGDYRAIDITEDRLNAYIVYRKQQDAANATINRELAALKRAFRLASRKVGQPPRFQMLSENNARKGFFEADQFQAVLKHLPELLKPVFQAAYITGWRVQSELLTRRWQHVDLEGGWLRLEPGETKNEDGRMFPLIPELREILAAQKERTH